MSTQLSTKVRLVRCPRCREILPELPNVSVYMCGGCGTTLQAKNRGHDANHAESSPQDRDILPRNQLDGVVEEKEARSVAGDSTRPPSVESSPDNDVIHCREDGGGSSLGLSLQDVEEKEGRSLNVNSTRSTLVASSLEKDNISCHDDRLNYNVDTSNGRSVGNDCPRSLGVDHDNDAVVEVTQAGKEDVTQAGKEDVTQAGKQDVHVNNGLEVSNGRSVVERCLSSLEVDHGRDDAVEVEVSLKLDGSLTENCGNYDGKFRGGSGKWSGSSSDVVLSPGEIISESEPDVPEADVSVEPIYRKGADHIEGGEPQSVWQEGDDDDLIDEIEHLPELEDEDAIFAGDSEDREVDEHGYIASQNDKKKQHSSADQSEVGDRGITSVGLDSDSGLVSNENNNLLLLEEQHVEVGNEEQRIKVVDGVEGKTNVGTYWPSVTSPTSWNESFALCYLTCPEDEPVDPSVKESTRSLERISSIDSLASSSLADLSSELGSKYQSMNNFLPTSSYYAYDGSESSYDGTDDRIHEHFPTRREKVGRDRFMAQSGTKGSYWARGPPHRANKSDHPGPENSTDLNEYASRFNTLLNKHENASRLWRTLRDPVASHKTTSPSSYRRSLLPPHPAFNSSDKVSYTEADKADMLRRVYELKHQLNQIQFPKAATGRRSSVGIPAGKFNPRYNHLVPEEELCSDLNHAYHLQRDLPQGYGVSRQAFSGEVAHYPNRRGCSCMHCHHQDWHYSVQLPARSVHCKNSCCAVSPQHYTSSELSLRGSEIEPYDQRHDVMKRLRMKEKYQLAKHLLPVAGGAPLVSCYKCWELLQLPVDFLLSKRRYHRLRCNACHEVLKFSLLKGTHLVPYVPAMSNPPPSMADGYGDDTARPRNVGPTSHSSSYQLAEDAISCSDHYRQSLCRSCSEGEASVISASVDQAPTDSYKGSSNEAVKNRKMKSVLKEDSYNREMSSDSCNELVKNSKMKSVLREDHRSNRNRMRTLASAGPSSQKGTSEIKPISPLPNSTLHRLMGYSSPSQVFIK